MTTQAGKQNDPILEQTPFHAAEPWGWDSLLPRWLIERPQRYRLPAPLTLLILAAALGLAALAPWIAANQTLALAVAGVIVAPVGLVMLLRRPILGFVALPPVALMVSFSIGTGSQTGVNAAVLLLGVMLVLWLGGMLIVHHRIRLLPYPAVKACLVFCVAAIVAFGFGQFPWYPTEAAPLRAQIGGLSIFLLAAFTILLAAHQIRSLRELEWIMWALFAVGAVYVVVRLVPQLYLSFQTIFVRQAAQGVVFYVWLAALGLSQILLNPELHRLWKAVIAAILVGLLYLNFYQFSAWVSGWLPALIAAGVVLFLTKPRLSVFVAIGFGLAAIFFTSNVFGVFSEGDNSYSAITRLEAWRIIWQIAKNNPIFGVGMANYYFYTPFYSILGYNVSFNSHNNFVDIVAQTGFVGLVATVVMFFTILRQAWTMFNRLPEGRERAFVVGVLGGITGTLVAAAFGDWVIPFVYNIGLNGFRASVFAFLFMGGLLALARMTDDGLHPAVEVGPIVDEAAERRRV